jgi:hypothetical protein
VANGVNVASHKSNMSMFSSSTPCATTSSSIGRPGTGLMQSAGTRLMTKTIRIWRSSTKLLAGWSCGRSLLLERIGRQQLRSALHILCAEDG